VLLEEITQASDVADTASRRPTRRSSDRVRVSKPRNMRVSCPVDFEFSQTAGPKVDLGEGRTLAGTTRRILFRRPGIYKLVAKNVQTSTEAGLQTFGEDNALSLTVRVK